MLYYSNLLGVKYYFKKEVAYVIAGSIQNLIGQYINLLEYCKKTDKDQKEFKKLSEEYAKRWSRISIEDQGEICESISKYLRG